MLLKVRLGGLLQTTADYCSRREGDGKVLWMVLCPGYQVIKKHSSTSVRADSGIPRCSPPAFEHDSDCQRKGIDPRDEMHAWYNVAIGLGLPNVIRVWAIQTQDGQGYMVSVGFVLRRSCS